MNVAVVVAVLALIVAAVAAVLAWQLRQRLAQALGNTSGDLETELAHYHQRTGDVDAKLDQLTKIHQQLLEKASLASQKISIVRFNPFGDTGGDQSFALAVLDDHNSGYVLTSIHGRGGTRMYIKPIDFGKSKYNLSHEEQQAIVQATKRTPTKEEA